MKGPRQSDSAKNPVSSGVLAASGKEPRRHASAKSHVISEVLGVSRKEPRYIGCEKIVGHFEGAGRLEG